MKAFAPVLVRQVTAVLLVWLIILGLGVTGAELYERHADNYALWSWTLQKSLFFPPDLLKVWNRRFYEARPYYFRWWPIPLEFFEADKPTPRYLFKPQLRIVWHGKTLAPAARGEPAYWSSNSWGFRGEDFYVKKPRTVIRIVSLGASTTEGSHGDKETYPYFLQQELRRRFPGRQIEVINAGHHGQGIDDLLEILRQRVFPLSPDVVIWYEGATDPYPPEFARDLKCRIGWPSGNCWLNTVPVWYRWLREHSAVFIMLSDKFGPRGRALPAMDHKFDDTPPKSSVENYRNGLSTMARELKSHKIGFVLSSFMTYTGADLDASDEYFRPWYPLTPGELARIYAYVNRQSAEVARQFRLPYMDVAHQFPRERRYFPFDIFHFSPEGNKILARLFADIISEGILPDILRSERLGSNGASAPLAEPELRLPRSNHE